ncbi:MAG: hypothetical protein EOP86_04340 [Verrucomicrobiaceae bacterium]|nr:MAG: hypothetical protein EOP86_04340 [Verrucomicrobiaceae bacterium]
MNPEIESLMSQYLDGRVSAPEAAELAKILAENPEAAARFAELTRMDEGLRTALKAESRSQVFSSRLRSTRLRSNTETAAAKRPAPDRRHRWLAAAAGLAVLGGTAWWLSRDGVVPGVVMDWAKSRVKRGGGVDDSSGGGGLTADLQASLPVDKAAELRRKLRGFAIPHLHMRSMALTDALNTLNRQWTDLPHRDPEDAKQVKIDLADSARKRWPARDKEPLVSVDMPNLSLHTALSLIAAQAGLQVEVAAEGVTLSPDENSSRDGGSDEKRTWTFPLTKPVADTFLASMAPPRTLQQFQPLNAWNWSMGNFAAAGVGADPAKRAEIQVLSERVQTADASIAQAASDSAAAVSQEQAVTLDFTYGANMNGQGAEHWVGMVQTNDADPAGAGTDRIQHGMVRLDAGPGTDQDDSVGLSVAQEQPALPALAQAEAELGVQRLVEGLSHGVENSYIEAGARLEFGQADNSATYNLQVSGDTAGAALGTVPVTVTSRFLTVQPSSVTWFEKPPEELSLESWLTGLNGGSMTHDTENGIISVSGSPGELRTASAAIAALSESAQAGVSVEARLVRLGGNEAPDFLPEPDEREKAGLLPAERAVHVPAGKVDQFLKSAAGKGISVVRLPSAQGRRNQSFSIALDGSSRPAAEKPAALAGVPLVLRDPVVLGVPVTSMTTIGVAASGPSVTITADKSGEEWTVRSRLPDAADGTGRLVDFPVTEGSWVAVLGVEPGGFLLMRFRSAAVQP